MDTSSLGIFLSLNASSCLGVSLRRVKPILSLDMTTLDSFKAGCLPGECPCLYYN